MTGEDRAPARYHEEMGCWVVADSEAAKTAFRMSDLSSRTLEIGDILPDGIHSECPELMEIIRRWFVLLDGDEHISARRDVQPMFSPGRIRQLEDVITDIVEEAVEDFGRAEVPDAIPHLTNLISARTMARLLGLPRRDAHQLHAWAGALADFFAASYRLDYATRAQEALREMGEFIRTSASDGVWQRASGTELERLATSSLMLFGGLETTAALMGFTLWYTLGNELVDSVTGEDGAAEAIVERVLELYPPLGHVARATTTDVGLGDDLIPKGELILVSLTGSSPFEAPACPVRPPGHQSGGDRSDHLAFGHGMHYCMGAPLARLEAATMIKHFARRYPRARVRDLDWGRNRTYRGFDHLFVDLAPAS
ncbi:cytochrome P450 [Longispora fulva]|uniref:Cytochrome P450 n=1 Tax=Longispora fulva TaxID=619741 RepID=A0A8J7KFQ5_9ACTN|nr:cytochrome P450 [Longispora fulva]MBG6134029.1 cytochrome P450 [Longispora fulva]GIG63547.1 cytochrome P450 [Longispora fulva]